MKEKDPKSAKWGAYLSVLREENILIGSCAYKGAPDEQAIVEIGFEVASPFRNSGLATEISSKLVDHTYMEGVAKVIAHTLP